jgi:hypothetical protein
VASGPAKLAASSGWPNRKVGAARRRASRSGAATLRLHQHAIGGGAALPGRQVAADQDLVGGLAERWRRQDDTRVLAAHLERDQELGAIERRLLDAAADRVAAGEAQALDPAVGDQRRADRAGADDQVEHAGRQAGGGGGLGVALAGQRRDVRRLDHHGVAGEQRRHDVGVAQVDRVVVRADHRDHAERVVAQLLVGRAGDRALAQVGGGELPGHVEPRQHGGDLLLGLAADLAGLQHDRLDQVGLARGDGVLPAAERGGAIGQGEAPPPDRGGGGGVTGGGDRALVAGGLEHDRAVGGRVVRAQGGAAGGNEHATDEVAKCVHRGFVPGGHAGVKATRGIRRFPCDLDAFTEPPGCARAGRSPPPRDRHASASRAHVWWCIYAVP